MGIAPGRVSVAAAATLIMYAPAAGQETRSTQTLPSIVVTAGRTPQPLEQTGSAITVVPQEDIATTNPTTVVDALRAVPGLDISENGGPGGTSSVRLRGANAGQTLVLIDGVRVNDPAASNGDFDFSMFPPGLIERVEVLRGPQSALYGSDAIGGVINIITRTGGGPPRANIQAEAGRYGTASMNAAVLGSHGPWSYAFSGVAQKSDGFSRFGYRIPALEARFPNLESDGFNRLGGYGRVGYDAGDGVRFDLGALSSLTHADYDQATGAFPDTPSVVTRLMQQVWARGSIDTLDGVLTHSLNVFANRTERSFNDVTYRINTLPVNTTSTISDFIGDRIGAEYQGNLRLGDFGTLIAGAKVEHETAHTFTERLLPTPLLRRPLVAAQQDTRSVFGLWQLPITERLMLSLGGRVDDIVGIGRFETWRATAAYLIPESGAKLRTSAGTGGRAPTLFQLYEPTFGNSALHPEKSFGWDAGIDQSFFSRRVTVSATYFSNRLENLIEFDSAAMRFFNVGQAETSGFEVGADAEIWPSTMRLKVAYTYLSAKDLRTNLTLQRRPPHSARVAVAITPMPSWLIEPRLFLVSERFSSANETNRLAPYARLDIYSDYRIDATWKAFARLENVTNTRYQEVFNFGTTGPAAYVGFNATW